MDTAVPDTAAGRYRLLPHPTSTPQHTVMPVCIFWPATAPEERVSVWCIKFTIVLRQQERGFTQDYFDPVYPDPHIWVTGGWKASLLSWQALRPFVV